jgi:hypothetical protein
MDGSGTDAALSIASPSSGDVSLEAGWLSAAVKCDDVGELELSELLSLTCGDRTFVLVGSTNVRVRGFDAEFDDLVKEDSED